MDSAAHEANETKIEAQKREATDQANGAYLRAVNRGWSHEQATKCWHECFETWMQD